MEVPNTYLFVATFQDGTKIFQNEEDQSSLLHNKSQFYDVQEKEKESPLKSFVIRNEDNYFGVDLEDGHFECNDVPFFQHRPELAGENYSGFKVIYTRTTGQEIEATIKDGQVESAENTRGFVRAYTIGWECKDPKKKKGENVKKTFSVYFE